MLLNLIKKKGSSLKHRAKTGLFSAVGKCYFGPFILNIDPDNSSQILVLADKFIVSSPFTSCCPRWGISPLRRSAGLNYVLLKVNLWIHWRTVGIFRPLSERRGQANPRSLSGRGYLRDELYCINWEPWGGGLLGAHPITGQPGGHCENHHDSQSWQRPAARRSYRPRQEVRTWLHASR